MNLVAGGGCICTIFSSNTIHCLLWSSMSRQMLHSILHSGHILISSGLSFALYNVLLKILCHGLDLTCSSLRNHIVSICLVSGFSVFALTYYNWYMVRTYSIVYAENKLFGRQPQSFYEMKQNLVLLVGSQGRKQIKWNA